MQGRIEIKKTNPLYNRLKAGFSQWLRILNFEATSQRDMPKMLNEFLNFLTANNCHTIREISEIHLQNYLEHLQEKPSRTKAGGLSMNYIRKHLQVIKKFARYLAESNQESFEVKLKLKGKTTHIKSILTCKEIEKLYQATTETVLGLRDRAMLALYYGCGLRKNEGLSNEPK